MMQRLDYWRRITKAYLLGGNSNLTFWHETPAINSRAVYDRLGPYYMTFAGKAAYPGPFDADGVPRLDYHGTIGVQYNPIAIAQYGLAHYNLFEERGGEDHRRKFLAQADWLVRSLELNPKGFNVWNHHFDFDYRERLIAPWYSGLAQGQGLSALARAYQLTGDERYLDAMRKAYAVFEREGAQGGVLFTEPSGDVWIEEYIVTPPSHILNGFFWALWGLRDYIFITEDKSARRLFDACVGTIERNLSKYDNGFWSLYELSPTFIPMITSRYYHGLHITQLRVTEKMTGRETFGRYAVKWAEYGDKRGNRALSLAQKCLFKVFYY